MEPHGLHRKCGVGIDLYLNSESSQSPSKQSHEPQRKGYTPISCNLSYFQGKSGRYLPALLEYSIVLLEDCYLAYL